MPRWMINSFLIVMLLGLGYLAWLSIEWKNFLDTPLISGTTSAEIEIAPGTTPIELVWNLKRQGFIDDPDKFLWLIRLRGDLGNIKAGEYLITPQMTPIQLLKNIVTGKVIMRQLTILEGWTFKQLMSAVNNNVYLKHDLSGLDNQSVMEKLGYANLNPEGRFYPDTYLFAKGTSDIKILKKSYDKMQTTLDNQWKNRTQNLPYKNSYEALIAASLIERETAVSQERVLVSGVILRRLQKKMRLQIDPTVIYALGDKYQGKLHTKDLLINSPYNTYVNQGLPPTPIAMPSAASIYAALHPAAGDTFYYVADGKGGHIFSASLKQHDKAVDQYISITAKKENAKQMQQYMIAQIFPFKYKFCSIPNPNLKMSLRKNQ